MIKSAERGVRTLEKYEATIGLEVHVQLSTDSKIFCGCSTRFGAPPNSQACPICLGMPGVLPVLNRKVVELAIRTALAANCTIARQVRFARKNYFYPDLPKGYQISMYELPLAVDGWIEIPSGAPLETGIKRIGLIRIHMEEDAGKNLHEGIEGASHVDLNRAGVPLLEIVSHPDLSSSDEAVAYLKKLHDLLVYIEVSAADMEKGMFRCDANISLRPRGARELGTRAEIKNINSFKFVREALEYEIARQEKILAEGGKVVQETRLFDSQSGTTRPMRSKEEAHDYRYFPEPDLVPLEIPVEWIDETRKSLPELPDAKRARFVREYSLPEYDAAILTSSRPLADYFEQTARLFSKPKVLSNWIMTEILARLDEGRTPPSMLATFLPPKRLASLLTLVEDGTINRNAAKTILEAIWGRPELSPEGLVKEKGLGQLSDLGQLEKIVDQVLAENPSEVASYRAGKKPVFGFLVGQVMKRSGGKANPAVVNALLKKRLEGSA